ncbi:MAG: hypothetical protein AB7O96_09125 [Pseudobdellovibrionaceae bacterium]
MKWFTAYLVLFLFSIMADAKIKKAPMHLDLEATSKMYQRELTRRPMFTKFNLSPADRDIEVIIAIGKRNLDWLIFINQHLETPISFTKPGSLTGIPITEPKKYSGNLTLQRYQEFLKTLPAEMKEVLVDGKPFTPSPPVEVETYLKLGNEMDKIYQTATRWKLMQPYLDYYSQNRQNDIRGYYFLKDIPDLDSKLTNFATLPDEEREKIRTWLVNICFNTWADETTCKIELSIAESQSLVDFKNLYIGRSAGVFNEYYKIQNPRPELVWTSENPLLATLPFKIPGIAAIQDFLAFNIEDEWKWNDWQFKLDFREEADVHVDFQPGVTPHVNELGGNSIVMDSNSPLTEWDVQWTIRHEFGHVLGLPDCYVEFYDKDEGVMINYQIDTSDMMCSRMGKMNQRIYDEMKVHYLK